uniref:Uncharacterized protein n=1 Tax=Ixodes ricinus TaxID=34613 RepID=A0A0K8RFY9_IXORI
MVWVPSVQVAGCCALLPHLSFWYRENSLFFSDMAVFPKRVVFKTTHPVVKGRLSRPPNYLLEFYAGCESSGLW